MTKRKPTKHEDDILRNIRQPDRYDPKARSIGGPWRMVKCKDGAYVCYEQHLDIIDNLRKNAEIDSAQSPHDGIHTCSKGCRKPGCNRGLKDTIEEQDAQIVALKQDILEKAAELRRLHRERVHDLNQIGGLQEENQSLAGQVRQFEEHRDTAAQIIKRLEAEVGALMTNPTSRILRAKQADKAVLVIENSILKDEVERLKLTLEEERQIARQDWAGLRCEHDRVKRALEHAEAELARLRAQFANSEWQPIETAPKDATLIIGWSKEYANPFIVLWTCLHQWDDPKDVFGWVEAEGDWSTGIELTHWTHLPKPPTK